MKLVILIAAAFALSQAPPLSKADQLQDAARKGDAAAVKKLLDEGVDVNTKFRYNATAIFYACDAGAVEVVKVLLDKGADLTIKDTFYGFTPLALAVSPARKKTPAHKEIARLLIAKGAPGADEMLAVAVEDGDAEIVQTILDAGPIPPAKLSDALEAAKTAKKDDIVALLEKAGAKAPDVFKMDPATLARFAGTYQGPQAELEIAVVDAGLTIGQPGAPPAQRGRMVPKDAVSFRGVGMNGMVFIFDVSGEKVTGFKIVPPAGAPIAYTRVEK